MNKFGSVISDFGFYVDKISTTFGVPALESDILKQQILELVNF